MVRDAGNARANVVGFRASQQLTNKSSTDDGGDCRRLVHELREVRRQELVVAHRRRDRRVTHRSLNRDGRFPCTEPRCNATVPQIVQTPVWRDFGRRRRFLNREAKACYALPAPLIAGVGEDVRRI